MGGRAVRWGSARLLHASALVCSVIAVEMAADMQGGAGQGGLAQGAFRQGMGVSGTSVAITMEAGFARQQYQAGEQEQEQVQAQAQGRRQADNCAQLVEDISSVPCWLYSGGAGEGPGSFAWGGRGWEGGWLGSTKFGGSHAAPRVQTFERLLSPGLRYNSPVISHVGIHVAAKNGILYTLNFFGEIKWLATIESGSIVDSSPTVYGNMMVVPTSVGIFGFDLREDVPTVNRMLWKVAIEKGSYSVPTVAEGTGGSTLVYATSDDQNIYCIEVTGECNGQLHGNCPPVKAEIKWQSRLRYTQESQPFYEMFDVRCLLPNTLPETAFLDCVQCTQFLPCSDSCSFCEDQTVNGISPLRSTPAFSRTKGLVYVTAWDGLHALSSSTGTTVFSVLRVLNSDAELTERRTLGTGWERMRLLAVSPIVVKGEDWEYVLFASGPHMYAVDAASGQEIWHVENLQDFISTPAWRNDSLPGARTGGDVVIGTRDGAIMAIGAKDGRVRWAAQVVPINDALNLGVTSSLAPVVDSFGWVFALSGNGIVGIDGDRGAVRWYETACIGKQVRGGVALTDDGQLTAVCDDMKIRGFCCAECQASIERPPGVMPRGGQNASIDLGVRNIKMWKELDAYPVCVVDGESKNGTYRGVQRTTCTTPLISDGAVVDVSEILVSEGKDGFKLYDDCPLPAGSKFGATVKCGFGDAAGALSVVCKEVLRDERAYFLPLGDRNGACEIVINASVQVVYRSIRPSEECLADSFTFSFPTVLNVSAAPIPAKIPRDYTDLITNIVVIAVIVIVVGLGARAYNIARAKAIERAEDAQIKRMYDYITGPDLPLKTQIALRKAKMRIVYGQIVEMVFGEWSDIASVGRLRRIFERVLKVKGPDGYEVARAKYPTLANGTLLAKYAKIQAEGGLESWSKTRTVLDAILKFSPGWGDAWGAYLDGEIFLYKRAEYERMKLYAGALHGRVWTDNYDNDMKRKDALWGEYHPHSIDLALGKSILGPSVTRKFEQPHLAVANAGMWGTDDGVVAECEAIFFGGDSLCAVGVAEKGVGLSAEHVHSLLGRGTWMFLSEVSSYTPVPIHSALNINVVDVKGAPSASLFEASNLFVTISVPHQVVKTSVSRDGIFDENFTVFCTDPDDTVITFEVSHWQPAKTAGHPRDAGKLSKTVVLSRSRVSSKNLLGGTADHAISLNSTRDGWGFGGGFLRVRVMPSCPLGGQKSRDLDRYNSESRILFQSAVVDDKHMVATDDLSAALSRLGYGQDEIARLIMKADARNTGRTRSEDFVAVMTQMLYEVDQSNEVAKVKRRVSKEFREKYGGGATRRSRSPARKSRSPQRRSGVSGPRDGSQASSNSSQSKGHERGRPGGPITLQGETGDGDEGGGASEGQSDQGSVSSASVRSSQGAKGNRGPEWVMAAMIKSSPLFRRIGISMTKTLVWPILADEATKVKRNAVIHTEGDAVSDLIVVVRGKVSVNYGGSQVAVAKAGAVLLEAALLSSTPSPYSLVCYSSTALISRVPKDSFFTQLTMSGFARKGERTGNVRSGKMLEDGKVVQSKLGNLRSGDRVKMQMDRNKGQLAVWRNGRRMGAEISHVPGHTFPCFVMSMSQSSWSLVRPNEEDEVVRIVVVGADNLPKMDMLVGSSDPYVIVEHRPGTSTMDELMLQLESTKYKTRTMLKNLNPVWDEAFVVPKMHANDSISFEVWDFDFLGGDDIIGKCSLHLLQLKGKQTTELSLPILDDKGRPVGSKGCVLRVRIELSRSGTGDDVEEIQREKEERGPGKGWSALKTATKASAATSAFAQLGVQAKKKTSQKKIEIRKGLGLQFRLWEGGSEGESHLAGGTMAKTRHSTGSSSFDAAGGGTRSAQVRDGGVFRAVSKDSLSMRPEATAPVTLSLKDMKKSLSVSEATAPNTLSLKDMKKSLSVSAGGDGSMGPGAVDGDALIGRTRSLDSEQHKEKQRPPSRESLVIAHVQQEVPQRSGERRLLKVPSGGGGSNLPKSLNQTDSDMSASGIGGADEGGEGRDGGGESVSVRALSKKGLFGAGPAGDVGWGQTSLGGLAEGMDAKTPRRGVLRRNSTILETTLSGDSVKSAAVDAPRAGLTGLPGSIPPDAVWVRQLFARVFSAPITLPQIRYFHEMWMEFERFTSRLKNNEKLPADVLTKFNQLVRSRVRESTQRCRDRYEGQQYNSVKTIISHGCLSFTINEQKAADKLMMQTIMTQRRGTGAGKSKGEGQVLGFAGQAGMSRFLVPGSMAGIAPSSGGAPTDSNAARGDARFEAVDLAQSLNLRSMSVRQKVREEEGAKRLEGKAEWWSYKYRKSSRSPPRVPVPASSELVVAALEGPTIQMQPGRFGGQTMLISKSHIAEKEREDDGEVEGGGGVDDDEKEEKEAEKEGGGALGSLRDSMVSFDDEQEYSVEALLQQTAQEPAHSYHSRSMLIDQPSEGEEEAENEGDGVDGVRPSPPAHPAPPAEQGGRLRGDMGGAVAAIRLKKYVKTVTSVPDREGFKNISEKTMEARAELGRDRRENTKRHLGDMRAVLDYFSDDDESKAAGADPPKPNMPWGLKKPSGENFWKAAPAASARKHEEQQKRGAKKKGRMPF